MTPQLIELARREGRSHPTWEMALLYPDQGRWTVDEYLRLDIGRHVEFSEGILEFQPMPNAEHQAIVFFLVSALRVFAGREGGLALMAPLPMQLWKEKFREPDVLFLLPAHVGRNKNKFFDGADLVMEVVSENNRAHDLETKREEYARAGIPEYWIVDPQKDMIYVFKLKGKKYAVHGEFKKGQCATSPLLPGFEVEVKAALGAK